MKQITFFSIILIIISCSNKEEKPVTLFSLKDKSTGITFENGLKYDESFNPYTYHNFYNGGGVALGDINNDGLEDVYFTGNIVDNKLYLNKGNWKFEDITTGAGVSCTDVWSSGATFVDINHDGWLDLYVCKSGKPGGTNRHNELFINNGDLTFTEKSKEYGLDITGLSVQAAFFDYDKDGDLDCYILNNSMRSVGGYDLIKDQRNTPDPEGNKFLRNENGIFVDISKEAGIYSSAIGFGLGITLSDFNNDSWPDIYISNDFFERDYLYLNDQNGGFTEALEKNFSSISMGSMGADASDLNNDLLPDLMVTEMLPSTIPRQRSKANFESWNKYALSVKQGYFSQFPRNVLQRNMGKDGFLEIGRMAGVSATEWSWGALIFDMDNDGLRDIFVSNGIYKDLLDRDYLNYMANEEQVRSMIKKGGDVITKLIEIMPSKAIPNVAYKNEGNFTFKNKAQEWGLGKPSFSNGSAYGDLDNDGDLDLVVNNVNMPSFVYENTTDTTAQRSIEIFYRAKGKNTKAIGAKSIIKYGKGKVSISENYPSRGFQSSISSGAHFGVGGSKMIDSLIISWPDRVKSGYSNLATNKQYVFEQPQNGDSLGISAILSKNNLVEQIPSLFEFKHTENPFVDFNKERLLPEMLSNEGPALTSGDINGDNIPDFYVGEAKNGMGSLFRSTTITGAFEEIKTPFDKDSAAEDTDALFFDGDGDGDLDLYVCSGGKAFSEFSRALLDRYYINDGKGNFSKAQNPLPFKKMVSSSTISAQDFDRDGDIDLFVGGRFQTQLYGAPESGYVLENVSNNTFQLSDQLELENVGMITSSSWTDLNGDGWPDLILVGEWMTLKIYINNNGRLVDKTEEFGLAHTSGLWSGLKVVDIDGDGDSDIIAGNIGHNTFYKPGTRMYVKDFDGNGFSEQIICHKIGNEYFPFADRDELVAQIPVLKRKILYYKDYATASINDIFDKKDLQGSLVLDLDRTSTTLFINNGGKFSSKELPAEIQYSNVYAIQTLDIDGDGVRIFLFRQETSPW